MYLSNEPTEKERQLKMQMFMLIDKNDSSPSEQIWVKNGFFGDQKSDWTVRKENFPENTLVYCNQGVVASLKAGEHAVSFDYVILAQILPTNVYPPSINDGYVFADNEVPLLVPLYNTENGYLKGLRKWFGYITICRDQDEQFYSNGYDEEKSKILCANMKKPLPSIFQGIAFKKHVPFLIASRGS